MFLPAPKAALAAALFASLGSALLGCDDVDPVEQAGGYADAFVGPDAGLPNVRPETQPVRDAGRLDAGASDPVIVQTPGGALDAGAAAALAPDASFETPGAMDAGTALATVDSGPPAPAALQDVTIRFKAKVGTRDFVCGRSYESLGSTNVTASPRDFRLFVQDVHLFDAQGKAVPLQLATRPPFQAQGVSLLDFENGQDGCTGSADLNSEITGQVPIGDYRGLSFVNGVPESLNHGDPAAAPAPLKAPGMAWTWLAGYRFLKAEFARSGMPGSVQVHVGSAGCTGNPQVGNVTCSKPNRAEVRLMDFDLSQDVVVADLDVLVETNNLQVDSACHGDGDVCAGPYARLGLNPSTGQQAGMQRVFRVGP